MDVYRRVDRESELLAPTESFDAAKVADSVEA
jgi:hypothetical protein